jgi:hypothetical protein
VPRHVDNWYDRVWKQLVNEVEALPVGDEPAWFDLPAISQLAISTPALLGPFRSINAHRSYEGQVKPFNFMLIGHDDPFAPLPDGLAPDQLTPITPYTSEPKEYLRQLWVNRHDGRPLKVTTRPRGERGKVRLKTYGDVVDDYRAHPETKSGNPLGGLGTRGSVGLLPRLRVVATEIRHAGKESNRLDEVEEGLVSDPDEVYIEYRDERREWERERKELLRLRETIGIAQMARLTGVPERTLHSRAEPVYPNMTGIDKVGGRTGCMGRGTSAAV